MFLTVSSQNRSSSVCLCCLARVINQRPPHLLLLSSHMGSMPSCKETKKMLYKESLWKCNMNDSITFLESKQNYINRTKCRPRFWTVNNTSVINRTVMYNVKKLNSSKKQVTPDSPWTTSSHSQRTVCLAAVCCCIIWNSWKSIRKTFCRLSWQTHFLVEN